MKKWLLLFSVILITSGVISSFIILNRQQKPRQEVISDTITPSPTLFKNDNFGMRTVIPNGFSLYSQTTENATFSDQRGDLFHLEIRTLTNLSKVQYLQEICIRLKIMCRGIDSQSVVANNHGTSGTKYFMKIQTASPSGTLGQEIAGPIYLFDSLNSDGKAVLLVYPDNLISASHTTLSGIQQLIDDLIITVISITPRVSPTATLSPLRIQTSSLSAQ